MTRRLVSALYREWYPFFDLMGDIFTDKAVVMYPDELHPGDVLIVWGGSDIHPSLYGHGRSRKSGAGPSPSERDVMEWNLMQRAKELKIPIIGVCRGAQMLCALEGGHLIQHVTDHAGGGHHIQTKEGRTLVVNSLHHQMMAPGNTKHELLAWSEPRSNAYHVFMEDAEAVLPAGWLAKEPEFVYFPEVQGFAIQWHPEMEMYPEDATDYIVDTIREKLHALP